MKTMMRQTCLAAACVMLAVGAASGQSAEGGGDDFLQLADRLMDEAQRQHTINQRMDGTLVAVSALIDDVASNGLVEEGKAKDMELLARVLGKLNTVHVPNAAKYLEAAKAHIETLKPLLDKSDISSADGEIKTIIKALEDLLAKAGAFQSQNDLLAELRVIIQKQTTLRTDTIAWGKDVLTRSVNEQKKDDLASRQGELVKNVEHFRALLKDATGAATAAEEKARLQKASVAASSMDIEGEMSSAAAGITAKKPIGANEQQTLALKNLDEIRKILEEDKLLKEIQDLNKEKADLEKILKEQTDLRQKTEKSDMKPEDKKDLQDKQRDLQERTQKAKDENKDINPPEADKNLEKAKTEMKTAEEKMDPQTKDQAVDEQKKAEKDLSEAIKAIDKKIEEDQKQREGQADEETSQNPDEQMLEQIEELTREQRQVEQQTEAAQPKDLPKLEGPEKKIEDKSGELKNDKAKQEAKNAAEDLKNGNKEEAKAHEEGVIAALEEQGAALREKLAKEKMKMPGKSTDPDVLGLRKSDLTPDKTAVAEVGPENAALTPRERDSLYQKYERELPLEYKQLLEDYYEALSK